jgi:hypothetical protein
MAGIASKMPMPGADWRDMQGTTPPINMTETKKPLKCLTISGA